MHIEVNNMKQLVESIHFCLAFHRNDVSKIIDEIVVERLKVEVRIVEWR